MSLVWYYPARGLCSPGLRSHAFEKHSESILPWEWRMPDRGHSVAFQESHSASENNSRDEYNSIGATANRAVRILGDLNFASVTILIVIRRTERRWNSSHLEFHRER